MLDAGCGPGSFVQELPDLFGGKDYLGIELLEEFVQVARGRGLDPKFRFQQTDLYDFEGDPRDVVLLWAVLQHVEDTEKALDHLSQFTKNGFVILDSRPDRYEVEFQPLVPSMTRYYDQLYDKSLVSGRHIDAVTRAKDWANQNSWAITTDETFGPSVAAPAERLNYFYYSVFVSDLFAKKYGLDIDRKQVIAELESWRQAEDAWVVNRGGRWLVLEKPKSAA